MSEYYFNSKCYDEKGRRVGVMGMEMDGKLMVFELTSSLKDNFKREIVRQVFSRFILSSSGSHIIEYDGITYHPKVHFIDIKEGDSAKWTFQQYCKNNFYRLRRQEVIINARVWVDKDEELRLAAVLSLDWKKQIFP